MPCDCSGYAEMEERQRRRAMKAATVAACDACKLLIGTDLWAKMPAKSREWYRRHLEADARREQEEKEERERRRAQLEAEQHRIEAELRKMSSEPE